MNDLSREVMKTSVPFSCWNHGRARTCGFYKPLSQNAAIYSCPKHSSPQHKHLESIFSCGYDCIKIFHIFSLIHCENYLIFLFTTCSMAGTEGRGNCKRVPCSTHRPSWASQSVAIRIQPQVTQWGAQGVRGGVQTPSVCPAGPELRCCWNIVRWFQSVFPTEDCGSCI